MRDADTEEEVEVLDPLLGRCVADRYDVIGVLGRGGMGIVYEAVQRGLERPVAIKVVSAPPSRAATLEQRLQREARALASLDHPSVVSVYDVGRLPDGRVYLVMPRLEGEDLATVLERRGRLPLPEVLELLGGVARALDMVHDRGIVHRDIKPENLMCERLANGQRVVKLLDFGLALAVASESRITQEGFVVGTACYVSPEVARGAVAGPPADVYSLACVAFELLTGAPPFDDPDPVDTLVRKCKEDPPTLAAFGVAAPPEVEAALGRALARDLAQRTPRASTFLAEMGGRPAEAAVAVPAAAPAAPPEAAPTRRPTDDVVLPIRRAPIVAAATALLALVGVALITASCPTSHPPRGPTPAPRTETPAAPAARPRAPPEAPAAAPVDPPSASGAAVERRPAGARPAVARAPLPARAAGDPDPELARRLTERGTAALLAGRAADAARDLAAATLAGPHHAPAWRGLGLASERLGRVADAVRAYRRYLELAPEAGDARVVRRHLAALREGDVLR